MCVCVWQGKKRLLALQQHLHTYLAVCRYVRMYVCSLYMVLLPSELACWLVVPLSFEIKNFHQRSYGIHPQTTTEQRTPCAVITWREGPVPEFHQKRRRNNKWKISYMFSCFSSSLHLLICSLFTTHFLFCFHLQTGLL